MNKFIATIKNIFAIKELREKIIYTLILLVVFRLGSFIVLPGINPAALTKSQGGVLGILDIFLGGAFSKGAIFALGIMPYISASIVVQLLQVALPYFQKIQKEGESGRKKLNQITRFLTIAITLAQSFGYLTTTIPREAILVDYSLFLFSSMVIITTGTMFAMWIGERITEKGIGNGISMLIMIGIVSRFPIAIIQESSSRFSAGGGELILFILEFVALFFVVLGVVAVTQATRKIPVQYAKQVVGNKVYGGQRQFIPLKLISAGVMPIIFAQSLMFLPGLVPSMFPNNDSAIWFASNFGDYTAIGYNILFAFLIIVFTYFYTAIQVEPNKIADDIKRNNGFIPGVQPGPETSDYIDEILSKITLPGALFLALVAILPAFAARLLGITAEFSQFYGGTSLLIMVGVILDTLQQINMYLLQGKYDGLMESGKIKGQSVQGEEMVNV
ncbi:MAG: preprotein translocase subunit SecY [Bacteroidetes bacterium]|nr:MAG: preprotein translocase subunit SecY [Bacteroidota bacterium]TAG89268.1 MAG: preprotein translocase subunit SecY [Bacteroidota bacterium]